MSGRSELATALKAALPTWQIVSDARELDTVRKPGACVIWTSRRTRPRKLGTDILQDEVSLWVLSAADAAHLEDDLDQLVEQVMAALEPLEAFSWETAERGQLAEKFDGWKFPITCLNTITTEE